ncbi:MAG: 1-phosphofructokinase [Ruminococcus sp.]|nr:1-phosphofructokinase [Ruminococcus sp.]
MIYTVTFNPALDYVMKLGTMKKGFTNRTTEEMYLAGGKGLNVSSVLSGLGVDNVALGFTAGFTGNEIERLMTESGCRCEFIRLKEGSSRINVKLKESGGETEINAGGPPVDEEARQKLSERLDKLQSGDILVLAGSIPKTMPADIYSSIMENLKGRGVKFVVDAEKDLLLKALAHKPFLVKPNHMELGELFGESLAEISDTDELIARVTEYAEILRGMGAENVLVSMAGDGALLLDGNGDVHIMDAPVGQVVNSVGAGDAMLAGFLAGDPEKNGYDYALKLGIASGSARAFSEFLPKSEQIMAIFNKL